MASTHKCVWVRSALCQKVERGRLFDTRGSVSTHRVPDLDAPEALPIHLPMRRVWAVSSPRGGSMSSASIQA
jgi:hypothetical protein